MDGSKEISVWVPENSQLSKVPDPENVTRKQLKAINEWSQGEKSDRILERDELEVCATSWLTVCTFSALRDNDVHMKFNNCPLCLTGRAAEKLIWLYTTG